MKKFRVTKSFSFDGKRYFVRGDSEREVIKKLERKRLELEQGLVTYDGNMLVRDWAKEVLKTYKADLSSRARYNIWSRVERHILPTIGDIPLAKVKPVHCQKLINAKQGFSKEYIAKIAQDLRFIFEKAKENKMILDNPADHIVKPKGHVSHRRSITDHERTHLLKVCEDDRFLPFLFMLYCGCRPAEALEIQYKDIIEKDGVPFLHIRGTKTENSDRFVPVPPELTGRVSRASSPFSYVSLNQHNKPHTESSYRALTRALYRQMNISMGCREYRNRLLPPFPLADDFVPYCLRHTYCTDLQKKGIDVRTAQALMGHADIGTTANIYTHQDDETLKIAAEKMGHIFKGATGGATLECQKMSENV